MAAPDCPKVFNRLMVFALGAILLAAAPGCGSEAVARRGLKRIVHKEIKQFNKFHRREVKPNVYKSGSRFYRTYKERVDATETMRRTNSVDTPYIATLNFTENTYLTKRRNEFGEAKMDVHFIRTQSVKRQIIYAYVGGLWKKKETY